MRKLIASARALLVAVKKRIPSKAVKEEAVGMGRWWAAAWLWCWLAGRASGKLAMTLPRAYGLGEARPMERGFGLYKRQWLAGGTDEEDEGPGPRPPEPKPGPAMKAFIAAGPGRGLLPGYARTYYYLPRSPARPWDQLRDDALREDSVCQVAAERLQLQRLPQAQAEEAAGEPGSEAGPGAEWADGSGRGLVELLFLCSSHCCGEDCCVLNPAFVLFLAGAVVFGAAFLVCLLIGLASLCWRPPRCRGASRESLSQVPDGLASPVHPPAEAKSPAAAPCPPQSTMLMSTVDKKSSYVSSTVALPEPSAERPTVAARVTKPVLSVPQATQDSVPSAKSRSTPSSSAPKDPRPKDPRPKATGPTLNKPKLPPLVPTPAAGKPH